MSTAPLLPLLMFEVADCLMAVPASEVEGLEKILPEDFSGQSSGRILLDLGQYFAIGAAEGPWLRWARGTQAAWLRVRHVVDVLPVPLASLVPVPAMLRRQRRTRAFLAAGTHRDDVFLLLDPAELVPDAKAAS